MRDSIHLGTHAMATYFNRNPEPLSQPRRQLTPPLQDESIKSWSPFQRLRNYQRKTITADQSSSLLFSLLPPEIRHHIWFLLIGGKVFSLVHLDSKALRLDSDNASGISLLLTCRTIYAEAIPILYARNSFSVNHVNTLLCMTSLILPQRLADIRSLDFAKPLVPDGEEYQRDLFSLTYWNGACAAMTEAFTGMRELSIHLPWLMPGPYFQREWEPTLENLKYIAAGRPLDRFEVYVPWREEQCEQVTTTFHLPFQLVSEVGDGIAAHPHWSKVVSGEYEAASSVHALQAT